ncbi:glycoside hydrolase family 127 protein [Fictibacillus fluitans]|uniref:Glycoside hydrolase family 127 protein n=1 Tax=Fictibacillus fluitans TaxID=3058422 RepID=A0ABT8HTK9_9BACL|nr:beta-L-arabinofuranosidase domain-containing protein [Fictibacillus sp. NE201]MDN4524114.1 glycoside hydrolase family 127 protein [Fictibacillus sp. NE201]
MEKVAAPLHTLPLKSVQINDSYWSRYIQLVRDVVVPYQWEALNDRIEGAEPSHAIKNFKIAAGEEEGTFGGMVFQDSDLAKWLEAVGYLLQTEKDEKLEKIADEVIDLIAKAQHKNGYLNTYYTLKEPGKQWTDLCECHELYCAGHMIEAAVAYFDATGKRKILDVAIKLADHINEVFGGEPGKISGYDGHQEIELALVKLYETTGNKTYLRLSQFFLEERGSQPHFYDKEAEKRDGTTHWQNSFMIENKAYSQAHAHVYEQDRAIGHSVRFAYMCTGMAHLAARTGDEEMIKSCKRLWRNVVSRQMYITGGIGSQRHGEAFSFDYDLPNDTVYAETCASIGLIFFAQRMLQLEPNSEYADVMERALYNTVLAGMSQDGKSFFYVNPLEVHPQACEANENYNHVKPVRQSWFGCACCPPNVARLLSSLGQYIYTVQGDTLYTNLYIGSKTDVELNGNNVTLIQESNYPWSGEIKFTVEADQENDFTLALRLPDWCAHADLRLNGKKVLMEEITNGYVHLKRTWSAGDQFQLILAMPVERMKSHPLVRQNAGKVALQRGPLVYCLEEADNGPQLHQISLPANAPLQVQEDENFLNGLVVITGEGERQKAEDWGTGLYQRGTHTATETVPLTFIPYFAWANRKIGEMKVWVDEKGNR